MRLSVTGSCPEASEVSQYMKARETQVCRVFSNACSLIFTRESAQTIYGRSHFQRIPGYSPLKFRNIPGICCSPTPRLLPESGIRNPAYIAQPAGQSRLPYG
jgi:hypothetical protein